MAATTNRAEFDKHMVSPVNELLRELNKLVFDDSINIERLGIGVALITDFVWEYAPSEAAAHREGMLRSASMMETVIDQLEAKGFRFLNPAREGVAYVREAAERMASEAAAQPIDLRDSLEGFPRRHNHKAEIEHNDH